MKKIICILLVLIQFSYPIETVHKILHIGDSISKIGVQNIIEAWLAINYPNAEYISTDENDNGICSKWVFLMWSTFYKYEDVDILMLNSGMWDRTYDTLLFQQYFSEFIPTFKALNPKARIIWASGTLTNGLPGNDTISSNNNFAITVLDAEYGAAEWYYIDMEQVQSDSSVPFSGDNIHPSEYDTYAGEWINTLDTVIPAFTYFSSPSVDSVAYGVCKNGPGDFKSGTPTVTISNDTAYFSEGQIHNLMGVGAAVYYDDGSKKIGYIKSSGKINASDWLISNAVGDDLEGCVDATVDSINHEFKSIKTAFTDHINATHINNADRTASGADICVHIVCYMEQSGYTPDKVSGGYALFESSSGDASHKIYVYSIIDTFTQGNYIHGVTTPQFDSTKYYVQGYHAAGPIYKRTTAAWMEFKNLQLYQRGKTTTLTQNIVRIDHDVDYDFESFENCIFLTEAPNVSGTYNGFNVGADGDGGVLLVDNSLFICNNNVGTNSGSAIYTNAIMELRATNNTIVGQWNRAYLRTQALPYLYNNVIIGVSLTFPPVTSHDYNTTDIDGSEANGIVTTQTYGDLFVDTTHDSLRYWDYTPIANCDIDTPTILYDNNFNIDITGFLYDSAYSNRGCYQLRDPTIDSIRCKVLRDSTYRFAARPGDTCVVYGHGFDDSLYNTHVYQNSTGTVSSSIVSWHNNTDFDSIVIIPYSAVAGWYKPFITTKDSSISNNDRLWIKNPGGYY